MGLIDYDILVLLATLFIKYRKFDKSGKKDKGSVIDGELVDE